MRNQILDSSIVVDYHLLTFIDRLCLFTQHFFRHFPRRGSSFHLARSNGLFHDRT